MTRAGDRGGAGEDRAGRRGRSPASIVDYVRMAHRNSGPREFVRLFMVPNGRRARCPTSFPGWAATRATSPAQVALGITRPSC